MGYLRKLTYCMTSVLMMTSFTGLSYSAEISVEVRDRKPGMWYANGKADGPLIDVVKEAFKMTSHTPVFKKVPWARTLRGAKEGTGGMALRHSLNKKREEFMLPIIFGSQQRKVVFYKKKGGPLKVTKLEDLEGRNVGVTIDSSYFKQWDEYKKVKRTAKTKLTVLAKLLSKQRVDAVITNDVKEFQAAAKDAGLDFDKEFELLDYHHVYYNGRYMSFPKKSAYAQYHKSFNCAIYKMRKSGRIDKIFKARGVKPHIQKYNDPISQRQAEMCK